MAVKRAEGRRRLRVLVTLVVALLLVGAAWLIVHSTLLDIDRVDIRGARHVSVAKVRAASGLHRGDPILLVDLGAVRRRLEGLPWVDRARVDRRLPGHIEIQITESAPIAWARRDAGQVALLDRHGRVLAGRSQPPGDLPEVSGLVRLPTPGGTASPTAGTRVVAALPRGLAARTGGVTVYGGSVTLLLNDGPEVRIGPPRDIAAKGTAALAVLGAVTGSRPHYVDVQVPAAPIVG